MVGPRGLPGSASPPSCPAPVGERQPVQHGTGRARYGAIIKEEHASVARGGEVLGPAGMDMGGRTTCCHGLLTCFTLGPVSEILCCILWAVRHRRSHQRDSRFFHGLKTYGSVIARRCTNYYYWHPFRKVFKRMLNLSMSISPIDSNGT